MLNSVAKSHDAATQAAIDAFFATRHPTKGYFKKPGKVAVLKPQGTGRRTRVRHDLRKWLEETRTE